MGREEKIKAIYETIANKERTFGCNYIIKDRDWHEYEVRETEWECVNLTYWDSYEVDEWYDSYDINYLVSIIWHPVMIWDVISYLRKPFNTFVEGMPVGRSWEVDSYIKNINSLLTEWINTRLPIEQQSDECIDFIYNLIKNNA